jgi:hypothetical protein
MSTPVAAYGRHARLQHSPPQIGSGPPVYDAPAPQTWPAGVHPPLVATSQTPRFVPFLRQIPPQHCSFWLQASPVWMQ